MRDAHGYLPTTRPARSNLPYFDPFPDGTIAPVDVLVVINRLNKAASQAEAEDADGLMNGREVATAFAFPPLTPTLSPEYRGEGVVLWPCQMPDLRLTGWSGRRQLPSDKHVPTKGDASVGETDGGLDPPGWELEDDLLSLLGHDVCGGQETTKARSSDYGADPARVRSPDADVRWRCQPALSRPPE